MPAQFESLLRANNLVAETGANKMSPATPRPAGSRRDENFRHWGAGFIGSNFIRHVLALGTGYSVVNYDKLTYAGNLANLEFRSRTIRTTNLSKGISATPPRSKLRWPAATR